ncbi:ABC transporter permease [Companilactobacillus nuruki]|uniref:ABC transporter permease n=1 Tax=Companilactobacillus nuruki TaxID=1993540 RepID=A0A2N7ATS8_9LACO|nr:FtsX-like permease family protein [Companilactobacillus nuruki]PMD69852.1 ABC transporter permease [Companilactobacillus nuruki]
MKTNLNKNIFREFKFSLARFLSITILLGLGIFILVGLKSTGIDMRNTANKYYESHSMADSQIKSNLAFTNSDQNYIKQMKHVKNVEFVTQQDARLKNQSIRLQSLTKKVSTSKVEFGRLPNKSNEIALNTNDKGKYHLNQQITLKNNKGTNKIDNLQTNTFKIVGFVSSSDYLKKNNLATTNIGNGQIDTFGIVAKNAFTKAEPTIAKISYNNISGNSYSNKYENSVQSNVDREENGLKSRANKRYKNLIANKENQLVLAKESGVPDEIIQQQATKIKQIPAITYQIQSRNDYNDGYYTYGENAKRIDMLSNTFPLIFFAIALLVCLTTMSRMAEQKRQESGTLLAFGYTKLDTIKVYLYYGLSAAVIGTVVGAVLGSRLLPKIIYSAYTANFVIPNFAASENWPWIVISAFLALIFTLCPALFTAAKYLKESPVELMTPEAPKTGSKILLERVSFIWKHLSFNYKVTFRNIFRYKAKMLMTILGVMGCTALLITGFGLKDSLGSIITTQYSKITHYDVIGVYNPQSSKASAYQDKVKSLSGLKNYTKANYNTVSVKINKNDSQSVSLITPDSTSKFQKSISLINVDNNRSIKMKNDGAVITNKLAKLLNLKVGDTITIKTANSQKYKVKIAQITQMYVGHAIYMTPGYYQKVFNKDSVNNAYFISLKNRSKTNLNRVAHTLTKQSASVTVVSSNDVKQTINNVLKGLNHLVLIIIICSSLLAFVVLYTLTNINVSERIRELSTIKVLGFYPFEVVMYIYRETLLLTITGILGGYLGGYYLHNYIMQTLPPENAMAKLNLLWSNFAVSGVLTLVFSIVVMILMAQKINRVDMLEALKSVD